MVKKAEWGYHGMFYIQLICIYEIKKYAPQILKKNRRSKADSTRVNIWRAIAPVAFVS